MNRNKNTQVFQLILLHFNHGLIHIVFNTLQKLHRIISMDASSDHLRPTEEPQLSYILLYSENLKIVTFNTKRILIYLSRFLRCPLLIFQLYFKNQVSFHYWYIGVYLLLVMYFTLKDTVTKDYGTETSNCDIFYTVGRGWWWRGNVLKHRDAAQPNIFEPTTPIDWKHYWRPPRVHRSCLKRMPLANFLMQAWRKSLTNLESSQKGKRKNIDIR